MSGFDPGGRDAYLFRTSLVRERRSSLPSIMQAIDGDLD
jgi:hypothetical protein